MVVGTAQVVFALHGVFSLKQKRGIVRRLVERTRNRFNISVAEVDSQDVHGRAVIGLACVGNDSGVINSLLDRALTFMEDQHLAQVVDASLEILHV